MVDQELLQAMSQMMDAKLAAQRNEIMQDVSVLISGELATQRKEIMQDVSVLISGELATQRKEIMQDVRSELSGQRKEIMQDVRSELSGQRKEIMQDVSVLMDSEFTPKFNLLAENQQIMTEKLEEMDARLDRIEDKVTTHEIKLRIVE